MKQKFLIPISIIIAALIISGTIFYLKKQTKVSGTLPPKEAAQRAIDFINKNMLPEGMSASLISVKEENGIYKFHFKIQDREFDSYVTKNGKLLFVEGIDLTQKIATQEKKQTTEVQKRDKPDVKLFVMSYCPYGLQMEKALLPVWQILKDKTDIGIYFVDYIMHEKKEIDENLRQYCIQKEEKEKYLTYLSCFVKDGNFEKCLVEAGIDKDRMNSCISKADQEFKISQNYNDKSTWLNGYYPRFDVHTDLNKKYGVRGSPTLVINDVVLEVERSPEKVKEAICNAFLNPPSECQQNLSSTPTSPGFGLDSGSSSSGKCE